MRRSAFVVVALLALAACQGPKPRARIQLKDGTVHDVEVIEAKADALVVRGSDGETLTLKREDIVRIGSTPTVPQPYDEPAPEAGAAPTPSRPANDQPDETRVGPRNSRGPEGPSSPDLSPERPAPVAPSAERGGDPVDFPSPPSGGPATVPRDPPSVAGGESHSSFRTVSVPAGTVLQIRLESTVASDTNKVEDAVRGRLSRPLLAGDLEVFAADAAVLGYVTAAQAAGKVRGRGRIAIRFERILSPASERYELRTAPIVREAAATTREDATKVGVGAAAGTIVGGLLGGRKGAAVGAAAGAGAGGATVLATAGNEARFAAGERVDVTLLAPLTVEVPLAPTRGREE